VSREHVVWTLLFVAVVLIAAILMGMGR